MPDYEKLQRDIEAECLAGVLAYVREQHNRYRYGSGIKHQIRYGHAWSAIEVVLRDLRDRLETCPRDANWYPRPDRIDRT